MNTDRWLRVKEIFQAAQELKGGERVALITEACGADEELRAEVESLLREFESTGSLQSPLRPSDFTGRMISHYRVLSKLGAGGMGTVYKAEDTRLGRPAALKFLAADVVHSEEYRTRFVHEAKSAAAIRHPNICTVYEIDEAEGQTFLSMEFVDGPTLKDKIAGRPMPIDEALRVALDVGEGLRAAHGKGIVHRDIKSSNIMLDADGRAVITDFGLARLEGSTRITASGKRMGTPAFMSPEQIRGERADHRSDIWSLGVVLYEMVSGSLPFAAERTSSLAVAIEGTEPEPLTAVRSGVPLELEWVVSKMLAKAREERYQRTEDLLVDLRGVQRKLKQGVTTTGRREVTRAGDTEQPWRRTRTTLFALGALAAVFVIATWLVATFRGGPTAGEPGYVSRSFLEFPQRLLPDDQGLQELSRAAFALSPDGRQLAYAGFEGGRSRLYLRPLDSLEAEPIPGTEGARSVFFSPDGKWIGFWAGDELKRVPLGGGPALTITRLAGGPPFGVSWGPDDHLVFAYVRGGLARVPVSGGPAETITTPQGEEVTHRLPRHLPGGGGILYTARESTLGNWESACVYVETPGGGERKLLLENATDARYVPTGHLVFLRSGTLVAAPVDVDRLEVTGDPVGVVEGVFQASNAIADNVDTGRGQYSIADNGSLVYLPGGILPDAALDIVWADRQGRTERLPLQQRGYVAPRISPDGRWIAVGTIDRARDVWLYDVSRGALTRFTTAGVCVWPSWSPDGEWLSYNCAPNPLGVFRKRSDGTGDAVLLTPESQPGMSPDWSRAGDVIAYYNRGDIWVVPGTTEGEARPFIESRFEETHPAFSPDGRWLAYTSNESGQQEVYVQPYPGPGRKHRISRAGGHSPAWAGESQELFYRQPGKPRMMMAISVETSPEFQAGEPRGLYADDSSVSSPGRSYDVTPDGQRFVRAQAGESHGGTPAMRRVNLVTGWFQELHAAAGEGR